MELAEIKILIDKYYDGETTLAEETAIAEYIATHDNLPSELEVMRAIFVTTSTLKETKAPKAKPRVMTLRRRLTLAISGVAAVAIAIVGIVLIPDGTHNTKTNEQPTILCYKDGIAIENQEVVMAEAHRILGGVSEDMQIAMAKIEALNIASIH